MLISFEDFLKEKNDELKQRRNESLVAGESFPYPEVVYCSMVADYLTENGALVGPYNECYCNTTYKNAKICIFGYAIDEEGDINKGIDIVTCLYRDNLETVEQLTSKEIMDVFNPAYRFVALSLSPSSNFINQLPKGTDYASFAEALHNHGNACQSIRVFIITNCVSKVRHFSPKKGEDSQKEVSISVFDSDLWYKQSIEGKPQDAILIDFEELLGRGLPCVYVPQSNKGAYAYAYALTAIPGSVVYEMYNKYRDQLLEANVRSFLSTRRKSVNQGIKDTLTTSPQRFMAYNNGLVIIADKAVIKKDETGFVISQLHAAQIVNGGQTTASIYFTKRDCQGINLNDVRVAAKIIIFNSSDHDEVDDDFITDVSKYSNTQNAVKASDFEAHAPFHVNFEKVLKTIMCPDGVGRWFYERAAGSFNTYLNFNAKTATARRNLTQVIIPPMRRIQKKTDLVMCIATWDGKPAIAALGGEKCLSQMKDYLNGEADKIDVNYVKQRLAQYIIYRKSFYLLKGEICPQNPGGVRIALLSIISKQYKDHINYTLVWNKQSISDEFVAQIKKWGGELNSFLVDHAKGKGLSEYIKTEEYWSTLNQFFVLSEVVGTIPELQ